MGVSSYCRRFCAIRRPWGQKAVYVSPVGDTLCAKKGMLTQQYPGRLSHARAYSTAAAQLGGLWANCSRKSASTSSLAAAMKSSTVNYVI